MRTATSSAHTLSLTRWLSKDFYFTMALAIVAIVLYGFSQAFEAHLAHPPYPRPWILYVHAVVFPLFVLWFLAQTTIARSGNLRLHRKLGTFGLFLGALLPIVAMATAIVMDRLHAMHHEQPDFFPAFFVVHINDEAAFIVLIGLAALFRRRPALHSRLMFVATCILTDAPFSRFPAFQAHPFVITLAISYACADGLILCGVARDWLLGLGLQAVYRFALPALIIGQVITTTLYGLAPAWYLAISHRIIGA